MNSVTFKKYYKKYFEDEKIIQRIARKHAKSNHALYQELVQVGLITLWKLNPKLAKTNEDAWIRQAIKYRMVDYLRKEFKKSPQIVSLEGYMAAGDQLEKDPESGQFKLIRASQHDSLPNLYDDGEDMYSLFEELLEEDEDGRPTET